MKRQMKKKTAACICAAACGVCILAALIGGRPDGKPSLSEGTNRLQKLSGQTVAEVEKKISERDAREQKDQEAWENRTPNEKMANAVLLGDSRAEAFAEYEILDQSRVLAKIGIGLNGADSYLDQAIGLNPQYVFLSYGMNDMSSTGGDAEMFTEQYRAAVRKLKAGLPESSIYINTIMPVQEKAVEKEPILAHLEEFNTAIREVCAEEQVTCIETGDLAKEELYEPDGQHFIMDFYPLWFERMAEAAGL